MDKQTNEKIYLKKCISLCVTLLCVYGIPQIFTRIFVSLFSVHRNMQWFKTTLLVFSYLQSYALLACAILLIIFLFKRSRICKSCKAWNSMKKINVELVGRQATTIRKTAQVKTTHHDYMGNDIGYSTSEVPYDAQAEYRTYRHTFRCNQCGHTTHSNRSALFGA